MSKQHQSKFIFKGNYNVQQIKVLVPNFILTEQSQFQNLKVKTRDDFKILNIQIDKNGDEDFEALVDWTEK